MSTQKKHQAKSLYFQTDLNKTQIADLLSISRRSLHYWIKENNWDRLKKSATMLPAMLAENCYLIMSHFTQSLLSESRIMRPITREEADTLHKLTLSVKKLKNHSTLNERMEMFAHFMERVAERSPELAEQLTPFVEEHIENYASQNVNQIKPANLNDQGFIPVAKQDVREIQKDLEDIMAWEQEEEDRQAESPALTPLNDTEAQDRMESFHKALSFYDALDQTPDTPVDKARHRFTLEDATAFVEKAGRKNE